MKKTKNPKRLGRAKTDEIGNKYDNSSNTVEKIISVTKTSSRVYKPKIYKEVIIDLIYSRQ